MSNIDWSSSGSLAQEVCDILGWDIATNAIETRETAKFVEVTGTALHPNEWLKLAIISGTKLQDGRSVIVTDIPVSVDLSRNMIVRRKGRFVFPIERD